MALARYVITSAVTAPATVAAGEPGAGGAAGFGNIATAAPGTAGQHGWLPATFLPGMVVWADSSAGSSGAQLLYQAIGAANLRAYADTDSAGHAALAN